VKKSKAVTLILLTGALCFGCEEKVRNDYRSWGDCVQDYKDPTKCRQETRTDSYGVVHTHYYGPYYGLSRTTNPTYNPSHMTGRSVGISRGGWGSTGSHASS
jgi:hypothetical protein